MATPNVGILTNAGKNLIDQVNAGKTKIAFSKIVFSSMNNNQLTDDQIKALTTVAPQEVVINNPEVTLDNNTGETRIRATGTNEKLSDGVYVKTYGVFAKDDTGNEILYGLTVSPNPNYLPEYDGVTPQVVTYSYKVKISNTSNITFTNSNDVYVSDTNLAESLKPYAKIVYVNQQLDNKVTDNKNGTEQLNGVQVQPYNKLSDTIGGRNLLINTAQLNDSTVCLDTKSNISDTYLGLKIYQTNTQWDGVRIFWSYLAPKIKTNTNYVISEYVRNTSPTKSADIGVFGPDTGVAFNSKWGIIATLPPNSGWKRISSIVNIASFPTKISGALRFENATTLTDGYVKFAGLDFKRGTVPTSDWTPASEDKVNVSDMRKPASDVAGIEEVNAKQDKIGYTLADDSKVVHNSGNEEIAGQKTFDIAPIDKTTGNPYITKDGVPSLPSDLARTGQAQTFTAAQTFSIAPTFTDASKDKGDNQAATMADLKSVENSAWHQLNKKKVNLGGTLLYKIDQSSKRIYLLYAEHIDEFIDNGTIIADFSSIVKNIKTISGKIYCEYERSPSSPTSGLDHDLAFESPALIATSGSFYGGAGGVGDIGFSDGTYFTYDSLR